VVAAVVENCAQAELANSSSDRLSRKKERFFIAFAERECGTGREMAGIQCAIYSKYNI
jgi:hypothetical protein